MTHVPRVLLRDGSSIPQLGFGVWQLGESARPERLAENFDLFDFELDAEDLASIAAMDRRDGKVGAEPAAFNFVF